VEEEEQRILDTYGPILLQGSDSNPEGIQDVPIISYQAALEGLETLRLFLLQSPRKPTARRADAWRLFCIEKSGILRLYKARLGVHTIRLLSRGFLVSLGHFVVLVCISRYKKLAL